MNNSIFYYLCHVLTNNNIATNTPFARFHNAGGMGCMQVGKQRNIQPSQYSWHSSATVRYYTADAERDLVGDKITDYTYIQCPTGTVAAIKTTDTQHDAMLLATDHLGSIIGVWNASGTLLEEHRYSAWGLRTSSTANPRLRRGFTGHEHLAQFGLIDMQARLYDPHLGRFLAPDSYVQAPEMSMNFNRYAYCMNNPLKYVDPTGEVSIVAVLIGAAIGGTINLIANWKKIDNVWEGIASFAVGAGAGALTAVTGGSTSGFWASAWTGIAAAGVSSASVTATNNIVGQLDNEHGFGDINWSSVGHDALYAFGGGMAAYGTNAILSCHLDNSILKNTIKHIGNRLAYNIAGKVFTGENPFKNVTHHTFGLDASILLPLTVDAITYGLNQSQLPNKLMNKKYQKEAEFDEGYLHMKEAANKYTKITGEPTSITNKGFNDAKVKWGESIYIDGQCSFTVEGVKLDGYENFGIYRNYKPLHNVNLFLIYSLLLK